MTSIVRVRPFSLFLHAPRGTHFTLVRLPARWRAWKMRFFPYVRPTGETDGTIANDRSRFIEYVSTYCFVAIRGRRKDNRNVCWRGGMLRSTEETCLAKIRGLERNKQGKGGERRGHLCERTGCSSSIDHCPIPWAAPSQEREFK